MSTLVLERPLAYSEPFVSRRSQWHLFKLFLVVDDILALLAAFTSAYLIRFQIDFPFFEDVQASPDLHRIIILFLIPFWLLVLGAFQLYNTQYLLGGTQEYASIFNACTVAMSICILLTFFVPVIRISRGWITVAWLLALVMISLGRFGYRRIVYQLRRRGVLTCRTLIVGADDEAFAIADQLQDTPTAGAEIVGFVVNHAPASPRIESYPGIVGSIDSLPTLVESLGIEELIVSTATLARSDLLTIFETFGHSDGVELRFSSGLYELFTAGVRVKEIGSVPLVSMNQVRLDGFESLVKNLVDRALAMVGILALWPFLAVIATLIKLDSAGPVIYRRRVLGRRGRQFDAFKFRTMHVDGNVSLQQHPNLIQELKRNFKLKDDPRVTRVGRWLRRLSLDELPQLLNVLVGQMSLVGPRMISPEEGEKYGRLRVNLLTVKPGLTGLWQIRGRSDVSYDERVRLDMYYIRNYTIWLDIQIPHADDPRSLEGQRGILNAEMRMMEPGCRAKNIETPKWGLRRIIWN